MATIEFSVSFEPSPALAMVAALYERYYQTSTSQPFDKEACESAYSDWKAAMESVFFGNVVVPKTVAYPQPRSPDVTNEEIAEVGDALSRGYWPVT